MVNATGSLARAQTATVIGVDAATVTVECVRTRGLPAFRIVGLPDPAVREAVDRVRTAVQQCGLEWPRERVVCNLAPADLPKTGTGGDLAIACAVLAASGQVPARALDDVVLLGELGLDASVQPGTAALAIARGLARHRSSPTRLLLASPDARDVAWIAGVEAVAVDHLREVVDVLRGVAPAVPVERAAPVRRRDRVDLADVRGQPVAQRAMELAAAGGHHVLLTGPNGTGKSMLAARARGLLPDLSVTDALDVAALRAAAGIARDPHGLDVTPPLREVGSTVTTAGLLGGGSGIPRPGEVSLAHHGVLVLDELGEFRRTVLDALRQPLERERVALGRGRWRVEFACRIVLVATTNNCPCGRSGDASETCSCRPHEVARYRARLSEPLRDRLDLHVAVREPDASAPPPDDSAMVATRVARARARAAERWGPGTLARDATADLLAATMGRRARARIDHAGRVLGLSARGHDRVVRVARTIADLADDDVVAVHHVDEAVTYRAPVARQP